MLRYYSGGCFALTVVIWLAVVGCRPAPTALSPIPPTAPLLPEPTVTLPAVATPTQPPADLVTPVAGVTPLPSPLPTWPACGQTLPVQLPAAPLTISPPSTATLPTLAPTDTLPALEHLVEAPEQVALVAYQVGREAEGVYWQPDAPMPLASVVKLAHLLAYAQAVEAGELDPHEIVPLEELERFYLPRSDLGAHAAAVAELQAAGAVSEGGVALSQIVWMMIRHSSNAAADYLHARLGQAALEASIATFDLLPHSAPCPFLGRFLLMSNHTRVGSDAQAVAALAADPDQYAQEVVALTARYTQESVFRQAEEAYWGLRRRPSVSVQAQLTAAWDTQASARAYADLMARIIGDRLATPRTNQLVRFYLEWPMEVFPANRERYLALGYKNGQLPGVLTTVYYARPVWSAEPVVVALFYRDLPLSTYQRWRRTLPHDALAHWLMSDPQAIPSLHQWLVGAERRP